jgi:hypothetical protein
MTVQEAEKQWLQKISIGLLEDPIFWFGDYYEQSEATQDIMEKARQSLYSEFTGRANNDMERSRMNGESGTD